MAKNMSTEGSAVRREPADTRLQAVVHCSFSADIGERYGFVNRSIPDAELDAFVAACAGGKTPTPSGSDGLKAQILADAATESARTGKPVSVALEAI